MCLILNEVVFETRFLLWAIILPHQIHRMDISVFVFIVGQDLPEMRDVAGRQAQSVQFGELGVRWYPGERGLQPGESFGQYSHPGSLSGVRSVPLHLLALLLCHTLGCSFPGRCLPLLPRRVSPLVVRAGALAVRALFCALVGVFPGGAKLQDAVQELVVDIAERPGGHGELSPSGAGSTHGSRKPGLEWTGRANTRFWGS